MGSFSWNKADGLTKIENVAWGMSFDSAIYKDRATGVTVFVQVFEDRQYGVRFIFKNGDMVQFFEK